MGGVREEGAVEARSLGVLARRTIAIPQEEWKRGLAYGLAISVGAERYTSIVTNAAASQRHFARVTTVVY